MDLRNIIQIMDVRRGQKEPWQDWGLRMKHCAQLAKRSRRQIATYMGVSYSLVGHWQNGTRFPYLNDFFKLCAFIKADPRVILFGEMTVDEAIETIRKPHLTLAHSSEETALPELPKLVPPRKRPKKNPRLN